ncbi:MAG: MG2 domain-containing protein [Candidatus Pacebacteria bacterium]|nr:MG2 domain-containing protein [Candidatus Paceibacterota bacterium]
MEENPQKENIDNLNNIDEKNNVFQGTDPKKQILDSDSLKDYFGIQESSKSSDLRVRFSFYISQIKEKLKHSMFWQELIYFWTPKKIIILFGTILGVFLFFYILSYIDIGKNDAVARYRLVPEKISQSATIKISIPSGIDINDIKNKITFNPKISGNWMTEQSNVFSFAFADNGSSSQTLYFKPNDKLVLNHYYDVLLSLGNNMEIKADFLAVEDPRVINVFPDNKSEALEDSEIIILFNRPMIESANIGKTVENAPVEIIPQTNGNFKWISKTSLQFSPSESLVPSSNYEVKIKTGFVSLDGLNVAEGSFKFETRNLRYLNDFPEEKKTVIYNEPIRIYFNQPVDLKKMIEEIRLYNSENKEIPFFARYASKSKNNDNSSNSENALDLGSLGDFVSSTINSLDVINTSGSINTVSLGEFINNENSEEDKSIIEIFNRPNSFDRSYLWNLQSDYSLEINKAYPLQGDISFDAKKKIAIQSSGIVKDWKSVSNNTSEFDINFFDPSGKLSVNFYEDIDISKTVITSSVPISHLEYDKKCSDDNLNIYDVNCQKVSNKKIILISFSQEKSNIGGEINVTLKDIFNSSGQKINTNEISQTLKVYKTLEVNLGKNPYISNLSSLILCSNNPLFVPDKKDFKDLIRANFDYEVFSWDASWKQKSDTKGIEAMYCSEGDYVTNITVGFIPEKNYKFNFAISDVFGQKISISKEIITSKMEGEYISIFPMQQLYAVTSPDKTSISFGTQNINSVDLEICKKTDAYSFYSDYNNRNKNGDAVYGEKNDINCKEIKTKKISLSERYWINNYFTVNIGEYFSQPIGNYVIKISNSKYNQGKAVFSFLTVTNLAIAEKRMDLKDDSSSESQEFFKDLKNIYWVTNIKTQDPIEGAKVKLYSAGKIIEGVTASDGLALISPVGNLEVVVVENGDDSAIVGSGSESLNNANRAFSIKKSYIYTDKSNYQSGETVNIKGILRIGYDGNYDMVDKKAHVFIKSPKGNIISEVEINLDNFGSFNTSIVLDKDSALGSYSVCVTDYNCGYFNVLQGTQATFDTKVTTDKNEYISKDIISLDINANYYFGIPVENGIVEYTASARNYYFDKYQEGNYNFNLVENDNNSKFLFKGSTKLDINGKTNIKKQIDLDALFKDEKQSKIITFDILIKNSFGQTVNVQKSVIFHSGETYLGVQLSSYFISKNENIKMNVISTDINGGVKITKNINILFYKVDWVRSGNNWERKTALVSKRLVATNTSGFFSSSYQRIDSEGEYEVELSTTDNKGNKVNTKITLYVYGDDGQVGIQIKDGDILKLKTNKDKLRGGDTGELIIEAPYPKAKALITLERGKIFEYKVVDINGGFYSYKFKADSNYAPNVYVSVLLQSPDPVVKFAMKSFNIDSGSNKLIVKLTPDKLNYAPGEKVRLRVFTATGESNGVPAEVSLSVVGSSIADINSSKRNPYIFFYNDFPLTVSSSSNIKNIISSEGKNNESLKEETNNSDVPLLESNLNNVAYWKGNILTGVNGFSDVVFQLPDTLAYWQAEAVGVTTGSRIGVSYLNFNTEKEVTIMPFKPKFIISGDSFYVGVKIFNQSQYKKSLKVSFNSDSLIFSGKEKEVVLNIEKGDSQSVYFSVSAPKNFLGEFHNFNISIAGDKVDDVINQQILIRPNTTYSLAVNSNYSTENKIKDAVYVPNDTLCEAGDFSLRGGTNLSVFLSDSLNYLVKYPYSGSEQLASSLKGMSIVKRNLDISDPYNKFNLSKISYEGKEYTFDDLIDNNLIKIYKNQNSDGGFSFFGEADSNYYTSLKVLDMFIELQKIGKIEADNNRLTKTIDYIYRIFDSENKDNDKIIAAAFSLVFSDKYKEDKKIKNAIEDIIKNNESLNKISNQSLAQLSIIVNRGGYSWGADEKLNKLLDNRIDNDSRGVFIKPNGNNFGDNYENSIIDTALYLKSIAIGKRDIKNNEKIINWLINSRFKDGSWGSTQNTVNVIESFVEFLNWKKEVNAEYSLIANVNGNGFDKYNFNSSRIFDQVYKTVNIQELQTGKINTIEFDKTSHRSLFKDPFYYNINLKCYSYSNAEPEDEGFAITRSFYSLNDNEGEKEILSAQTGDILRAHLKIIAPEERKFVFIEDYLPAGFEILDMNLITDQKTLRSIEKEVKNDYLYPDYKEAKDDRAMVYKDYLPAGVYEFDYYVRATTRGNFLQLPSLIYERNNPEVFGKTSSSYFEIK